MTSPRAPNKRICVGKISSAHGVKGLVKILPYCEDLELLNGTLFTSEDGNKTLSIKIKNSQGKHVLASIEGITTPEDAKKLKSSLFVPREALPEISEDNEFYIEDLIGMDVKNTNQETIGTLLVVENFGAGDLLEIRPSQGGATYYIPLQDEYVPEVDMEKRFITVQNTDIFKVE